MMGAHVKAFTSKRDAAVERELYDNPATAKHDELAREPAPSTVNVSLG